MTYQGHCNYNARNISLYLANEYNLYRLCLYAIEATTTLDEAASYLMAFLVDEEGNALRTPDGVKYTRTNVRLALSQFKE